MHPSRDPAASGHLPIELTRFVGREREPAALRALLGSARLLTLTGAGGSGKSRLALELVQDATSPASSFAWVSLAPLSEPQLVAAGILKGLAVPSEGGAVTPDAITSVIGDADVLLVLDNCEHLVEACAEIADRLLRRLEGESTGPWRGAEQDRLRALHVDASLMLGTLLEEHGRADEAASLYERVVAAEPLLEEAHRRLLRLWMARGERPRALRHFQRLVATLQQLELEPDAETATVFDR